MFTLSRPSDPLVSNGRYGVYSNAIEDAFWASQASGGAPVEVYHRTTLVATVTAKVVTT